MVRRVFISLSDIGLPFSLSWELTSLAFAAGTAASPLQTLPKLNVESGKTLPTLDAESGQRKVDVDTSPKQWSQHTVTLQTTYQLLFNNL